MAPVSSGRILFVEDEDAISAPFSRALEREGFEPVVARTAAEALELAGRVEPDLVLLDLNLPDGDGRDVCRALRRDSDVPIVMLTARGTEIDRVVGLEMGADDYVVKPFSGAEVISRIRAVLRRSASRGRSRSSRAFSVGDLELDVAARGPPRLAGEELSLTRKEFDLLAELARNAGKVVTREDLMSRVWDVNWFGSTKTLDVHIGALRRKLGDDPAAPTPHRDGPRRRVSLRRAGGRVADNPPAHPSARGRLRAAARGRRLRSPARASACATASTPRSAARRAARRTSLAASSSELLEHRRPRRARAPGRRRRRESVRGRVIVVDADGPGGRRQRRRRRARRRATRTGPRSPRRSPATAIRQSGTATRSPPTSWRPRCRFSSAARRSARSA